MEYISGEIKGVPVSNMLYVLLYDYTLTIYCVIQAAKASGGLGESVITSQLSRPSVNFDNILEIQTFWTL